MSDVTLGNVLWQNCAGKCFLSRIQTRKKNKPVMHCDVSQQASVCACAIYNAVCGHFFII